MKKKKKSIDKGQRKRQKGRKKKLLRLRKKGGQSSRFSQSFKTQQKSVFFYNEKGIVRNIYTLFL